MRVLYILLIVKLLTSSTVHSNIQWSEIQPGILTSHKSISVENKIRNSLDTTQNFFTEHHNEILGIANGATLITAAIPIVPTVISLTASFASMLESKSDWRDEFAVVITKVIEEKEAKSFLSAKADRLYYLKEDFMPLVEGRLEEMEKEKNGEKVVVDEIRRRDVHTGFHTIISGFIETIRAFQKPDSIFKNYPLTGAPFFIELGLLISVLEPIAIRFTTTYEISCKIRDAMIDYIPFVVGARLEKVNAPLKIMNEVRKESSAQNNRLVSNALFCQSHCDGGKHRIWYITQWKEFESNCLIDDFGTKILGRDSAYKCEKDYAQHLRYYVEKMFPIEQLEEVCKRPIGNPTGFGYATIKLKRLRATHLEAHFRTKSEGMDVFHSYQAKNTCDGEGKGEPVGAEKCDPFVVVRINGTEYLQTTKREDTEDYNVDQSVTSDWIQKNLTEIEITVYDHNTNRAHEVIFRTNGTVDDFIDKPFQCQPWAKAETPGNDVEGNCLEIDVIWQPDREKPGTKTSKEESTASTADDNEIENEDIITEQPTNWRPKQDPNCKLSVEPNYGGKTEDGAYFDGGYVKLKENFKVGSVAQISFDVKPRTLNGLLFSFYGRKAMFVLQLIDGAFSLTLDNGDGPFTAVFTPENGHNFCDGEWHTVTAVKSLNTIALVVDDTSSSPMTGPSTSIDMDTTGTLFLGGFNKINGHTPFIGCMRNIKVRETPHTINSNMVHGQVRAGGCPSN